MRLKRLLIGLFAIVGGILAIPVLLVGGFAVWHSMTWAWESVDVPLPNNLGKLTFHQFSTHPFLAEYDRRVTIRLPDGRTIRSDIYPNLGGRTLVLLHWLSESDSGGPFLLMEESRNLTWINLGRGCIYDHAHPQENIPDRLLCAPADLPIGVDWKYFGRIHQEYEGPEFISEVEWPRSLPFARRIKSKLLQLPGSQWSFRLVQRASARRGSSGFWIFLSRPGSQTVRTWFFEDKFLSGQATVYFHPRRDGAGPYLQIRKLDTHTGRGTRISKGTLIDLDKGISYQMHVLIDGAKTKSERYINAFMISSDDERDGSIGIVYSREGPTITSETGAASPEVHEIPDFVLRNEGTRFGTILFPASGNDLEEPTFVQMENAPIE